MNGGWIGGFGCGRSISCGPASGRLTLSALRAIGIAETGEESEEDAGRCTQSLYLDMFLPVLTELDDCIPEGEAF